VRGSVVARRPSLRHQRARTVSPVITTQPWWCEGPADRFRPVDTYRTEVRSVGVVSAAYGRPDVEASLSRRKVVRISREVRPACLAAGGQRLPSEHASCPALAEGVQSNATFPPRPLT